MKLRNVQVSVDRLDDDEDAAGDELAVTLGRFGRFAFTAVIHTDDGIFLVPQWRFVPNRLED